MTNQPQHQWSKFYLKDVTFANLMMRRIYNILIVANPYDAFMLEDDGRIEEKIYNEYMELGMRYPPTFTQVSTIEEAEDILEKTNIDLVICMPGNADNDAFDVARAIKCKFTAIPCVVFNALFSWYNKAYAERRFKYFRLRFLLVRQHKPHSFNHKTD